MHTRRSQRPIFHARFLDFRFEARAFEGTTVAPRWPNFLDFAIRIFSEGDPPLWSSYQTTCRHRRNRGYDPNYFVEGYRCRRRFHDCSRSSGSNVDDDGDGGDGDDDGDDGGDDDDDGC